MKSSVELFMSEEAIIPLPETIETPISNPEGLLRAFEANKEKLAEERRKAAELDQRAKEMEAALEAQKLETQKIGGVLEQIMQQLGAASTAKVDPAQGIAKVLENFNAQAQLEEIQRQNQMLGEQRAIEKLNPQIEQLRKDAETYQQQALMLRQQQAFARHFDSAEGRPSEMENFFRLYGDRLKWDDSLNDFTEFRDANGNTVLDESGRPLKPVQALMKIRQGSLEGFGSMAQSAFVPFNQSAGGGTPASYRRQGGKSVQVYKDMAAAIKANLNVSPTDLAAKLRNGEIVFGE